MTASRIKREETKHKRKLVQVLKQQLPGSVVLRHEDLFRAGIPDTTVTWKKQTWWLEVKHATPEIDGTGIQLHTARQLADQGHCLFVVYYQDETATRTLLLHPWEVFKGSWKDDVYDPQRSCEGINHRFVAEYVRRQYRDYRTA